MPVARMTMPYGPTAEAVLAVLAGGDLAQIAASAGLHADHLADAVQTYHAAGTIALQQSETSRWHQIGVRPSRQQPAELTLATVVGPLLDDFSASEAAAAWWYLNKPPGWRIRLRDTKPDLVREFFGNMVAAETITAWSHTLYEPEIAIFGGTIGMDIAHDLFCADTDGFLGYLRQDIPPLGRHEISVLLVSAMLTSGGLDLYERADVFARIAAIRPGLAPGTQEKTAHLAVRLRTLLTAPAAVTSAFFREDSRNQAASRWHAGFNDAAAASPARRLREPSAGDYARPWLTR